MRHYEIVLLVHPDQSEQAPAMLEKYKEMVTAEKGVVHRAEDWGRRRLAYMINEIYKAHYIMLNVECGLETLRELEKNFKFNDSIVRSLVIRRTRAISEQSALARAKVEEDRMEAEKEAAQRKEAAKRQSAEAAKPPPSEPEAEPKAEPKAEPEAAEPVEAKDDNADESAGEESGKKTGEAAGDEVGEAVVEAPDKKTDAKADDKPDEVKSESEPEPESEPEAQPEKV